MAYKKCLVVDDEDDVRLFLEDFLAERDLDVDTAADAEEALEKIKVQPPDIMLLDVMMPGMDGLQCLEQVRKISPNTKVIMITALKDKEKINRAKKLGAHNYIVKPFSLNYLEEELTKLIS